MRVVIIYGELRFTYVIVVGSEVDAVVLLINLQQISNRITFEGKSNSMMKYPSPKFEWQAQENRRVEIVISEL